MSWNYSGNPAYSDRDAVRFVIGDTIEDDGLVQDEEIAYALTTYTSTSLAGAACLRSLAARFSREGSESIGDVSTNQTKVAEQFSALADKLDPGGVTDNSMIIAYPVFGSSGRDPSFYVGMSDIPGGPPDSTGDPANFEAEDGA